MKNGKKPKREQKKIMTEYELNCEEWLVVKDQPGMMTIVHRKNGTIKTLMK